MGFLVGWECYREYEYVSSFFRFGALRLLLPRLFTSKSRDNSKSHHNWKSHFTHCNLLRAPCCFLALKFNFNDIEVFLNMAPMRSKKRTSTESNSSVDLQKFPAPPQAISTKTRSPIKKSTVSITLGQKQALIDNLQLESKDASQL